MRSRHPIKAVETGANEDSVFKQNFPLTEQDNLVKGNVVNSQGRMMRGPALIVPGADLVLIANRPMPRILLLRQP